MQRNQSGQIHQFSSSASTHLTSTETPVNRKVGIRLEATLLLIIIER